MILRGYQYSIILTTVALTIIGIWLSPLIPLNFQNTYGHRAISINYNYPSAHPRTIEQSITVPIEGVVNLIRGVERINSEISYSHGVTRITLDPHANLELVRFEIAQQLRHIYPSMPPEVPYPFQLLIFHYPFMMKKSTSRKAIYALLFGGDRFQILSFRVLFRIWDILKGSTNEI